MTTYAFETITPAEALAIGASDKVTATAGSASRTTVLFQPDGTLSVTIESRTLAFGSNFAALARDGGVSFPDGSRLFVGTSGPDTQDFGLFTPVFGALYAGDGSDVLTTGRGAWLVQANQGNDTVTAVGGFANTIYGGQGDDGISIGVGGGLQTVGQFIQSNKGDDFISSGNGDDTLLGGQGNDRIMGGGGVDFMNGNLGDDQLSGTGQMFGEDGADTLSDFGYGVNSMWGGEGNDRIGSALTTGSPATGGRNFLYGEGGNDSLRGGSPDHDELFGGDGADTLTTANGPAIDLLDGGEGPDSLTGSLQINGHVLRGGGGRDIIRVEFGQNTIDGGAGDDVVFSFSDFNETISGGDGNDTIYADRGGAKLIDGGGGNDEIQLGVGASTVDGGDGDDFVNALGGPNLLQGGDGADRLTGRGDDTFDGGAGNDSISPGAGVDAVRGGAGSDLFGYASGASGRTLGQIDRILDWSVEDRISVQTIFRSMLQYEERTAPDLSSALSQFTTTSVNSVVAVQVGSDVVLFCSFNTSGLAPEPLLLVGRTLADISIDNFV